MNGDLSGRGGSLHLDAYQGADAEISAGDTAHVARILASFPGPVRLYPSYASFFSGLVMCLAFVAIMSWMLREGSLDAADIFVVWFALIASGLCAIVPAVMLLPGAASLTLDAQGFEQVSLYVKRRVSWRGVGNFTVREVSVRGRKTRFVGYDDAKLPARNANRRMMGRNASLPNTYRLSHQELASLMTQWRARALGQSH
ncbi:MAG TPA: hypothetical protein VKX28_05020 [Xanthobacteraceae bacterium]|nr:hypothetical protein [Xanthobacteraceae bacterium]